MMYIGYQYNLNEWFILATNTTLTNGVYSLSIDLNDWFIVCVFENFLSSILPFHGRLYFIYRVKVKVKSSMARSLPVENLLPQKVGSIINYFQ